jgi:uncharacterized protein (TIGR00251 family)
VLLAIHAQPGASRSEFAGLHGDALKVRIQAPAVDGKANDAMQRFLADAFGVSKAQVLMISGASSRQKRWRIVAPSQFPEPLRKLLPLT